MITGINIRNAAQELSFGVTNLSYRKRKVLYAMRNGTLYPLASFRNDGAVDDFCGIMELILKVAKADGGQ
jgi:hypothetical protein